MRRGRKTNEIRVLFSVITVKEIQNDCSCDILARLAAAPNDADVCWLAGLSFCLSALLMSQPQLASLSCKTWLLQ